MRITGRVKSGTDCSHLTVHHAAGTDDMRTRVRLGDSEFDVLGVGGVVVDPARFIDDSAVAVVGELIEAGIGHHDRGVAEVRGQVGKRTIENPVGTQATRAGGIFVVLARHTEDHQSADAGCDGISGSSTK